MRLTIPFRNAFCRRAKVPSAEQEVASPGYPTPTIRTKYYTVPMDQGTSHRQMVKPRQPTRRDMQNFGTMREEMRELLFACIAVRMQTRDAAAY